MTATQTTAARTESHWYAVVTFGSPTRYTEMALGNPSRVGRRVSRDLDEVQARAEALQGHVSDVRIVECRTRAQARAADISGGYERVVVAGCPNSASSERGW